MQTLSVVSAEEKQLQLTESEAQSVRTYLSKEKSAATLRAYATDWRCFSKWCRQRCAMPLPATPDVVAGFLASEADRGMSPSTINRRLAAIRYLHKIQAIEPLPTDAEVVRAVMRGVRRAKGTKPAQKAPATADILKAMIIHCPQTLKGIRDKAILLIGFASACRRSEIAALQKQDVEFVERGIRITINKSKTDQTSEGFVKPVIAGSVPSTCPIVALQNWIDAAHIKDGHIFRQLKKGDKVTANALSAFSIGEVVKHYATKTGLDATQFGGHSLRSGFCTSAAMAGADSFKIMDITGHKSVSTLRGYIRRADEFSNHAGAGLL